MIQPSLDELMKKVDSRYTLVVVAAKRARTLTDRDNTNVGYTVSKPVTTALMEIAENKVGYKRTVIGVK